MSLKYCAFIVLLTASLFCIQIKAQVPNQISWQGVLTDAQGQVLDGTYNLTTKLYNESVGGDALWVEMHNSKQIEDGQVNLILGSIENLNLQFNKPYWLEITVGAGAPLSRIQLTSVPYSLYSAKSNSVVMNDSLVLKDSLGMTRMVFNPNTGTFSMMDNDTVWYSISVNSPPIVQEYLPNGYLEESFEQDGKSVEQTRNPDGFIIKKTTTEVKLHGQETEQITNHYDDNGGLISSFIYTSLLNNVTETMKTYDPETGELISETTTNKNPEAPMDFITKTEYKNGEPVRTVENDGGETETITYDEDENVVTHMISSNNENKTQIFNGAQSTILEQTPTGLYVSNPSSNYSCGLTMGKFGGSYPSPICSLSVSTPNGLIHPITFNDNGSSGYRMFVNEFLTCSKAAIFQSGATVNSNLTCNNNIVQNSTSSTATLKKTNCTELTVNGITNLNSATYCTSLNASQDVTTTTNVNCAYLFASSGGTVLGDVVITGDLSVLGEKDFRIDHPDDPYNKYLFHASVESDEVLNQYSGNVVTDASGYSIVTLPDYVQKINIDFRYQLTVIGSFSQAIISKEIANDTFEIQTDKPNVKVSWLILAKRNDTVMQSRPFHAVRDKTGDDIGKLLFNLNNTR